MNENRVWTLTSRRAASAAALMMMFATLLLPPTLHAEDFYYVGEEKIVLEPSPTHKALQLRAGTSPAARTAMVAKAEGAGIDVQSQDLLKRYRIIVLQVLPAAAPDLPGPQAASSNAPEVVTSIVKDDAVQKELPVYEVEGATQVLINEFLVQFDPNLGPKGIDTILRDAGAKSQDRNVSGIVNRHLITFPKLDARAALQASNKLHATKGVEFSEPNFIRLMATAPVPSPAPTPAPSVSDAGNNGSANDAFFAQQWFLAHGTAVGIASAHISAVDAWKDVKNTPVVTIAIIDEGVATKHPDLKDKIVTPYDATDRNDDQEPNPWDGHGTACAGIAAAVTNNFIGVAGVAPRAQIMPVRIATKSHANSKNWITSTVIIEDGIRVAADRGAKVLSCSWAGGAPSSAINSGIDHAIAKGSVLVFAAGNDATSVYYPAKLSASRDIIAVSATNEWDELKTKSSKDGEDWWGSNFGPEISLAAPGVHIMTTDVPGAGGYDPTDYYASFNGTSSATPMVAGAVANLLTQNPGLSPREVRELLQKSSDDLGDPGPDSSFGAGRLNVAKALANGAIAIAGAQPTKTPGN